MSDTNATKDEGWKIQLSWKLGPHMLNVRGVDYDEFKALLLDLTSNPEMIIAALSTFDFEPPAPAVPAPQVITAPAPTAKAAKDPNAGIEVGPVTVMGIDRKDGIGKTGKPFVRFTVSFSSGMKASTFDTLVSDAAGTLLGKASYARVEKTQYGYDLLNVRPAA